MVYALCGAAVSGEALVQEAMPTDTRDILELLRAHVLRGEQEMMGLSNADREIVYRALLWLAAAARLGC